MSVSIPLENWGQLKLTSAPSGVKREDGTAATDSRIDLVSLPKRKESGSSAFVPRNIVSVPISAVASASGTTKNDVSISLRPGSSKAGGVELTSMRFAVPDTCVGYEQTEEAGKEILAAIQDGMRAYQNQFKAQKGGSEDEYLLKFAAAGGKREDETVVGVFDDVTLSYPSGRYKIVLSNYNVVMEDKKKGAAGGGLVTLPLSDILQLYLCDVPAYFGRSGGDDADANAQYVVLILKTPVKIRTTAYANIVLSCPSDLVLDEEHAWRCELKTQEEINKVLGFPKQENESDYPLVPSMSGRVSDILLRTFKAVAKVPAYGGKNKEYATVLTQGRQSCMRCLFHGAEGLLYVVSGGLLFLHRPATKIAYKDVERVTLDEAESGTATFQITVHVLTDRSREKYVFSGMDKAEKEGLMKYLESKVKVNLIGLVADEDGDGDEEDEEDDEEDDEEGASGSDSDDGDDSDDDDDFESDEGSDSDDDKKAKKKGGHKRERSKEAKDKKHKKHKKHKKEKKDKKHKKDKKDKKHKKDKDKKHKHRHHHKDEGRDDE